MLLQCLMAMYQTVMGFLKFGDTLAQECKLLLYIFPLQYLLLPVPLLRFSIPTAEQLGV